MKHATTPRPTRQPTQQRVKKTKQAVKSDFAWLSHHIYVFFFSVGQLFRKPFASLMTAAVIGIALALPTGFYLLLENVQQVGHNWGNTVQISLFLKPHITDQEAQQLADELYQTYPYIQHIQVISRQEALEEYQTLSGFGDALQTLDDNPLPAVLVIQPKTSDIDPDSSQILLNNLKQLDAVDIAQFDMEWLKRRFAFIEIGQRGVLTLASFLALAVLLVIGNTIRLNIDNRREEIEVTRLFGATDAFIRRPFLYTGFWYGLLGGIIAWVSVDIAFLFLQTPIKNLTALYHSPFQLVTLDLQKGFILLVISIFLGLAGAWLAVGRHLKDIQPH